MGQALPVEHAGSNPFRGPWVWCQDWLDLLFLHWQLPAAALRPHLPPAVAIETYRGQAWVSLVLFRMRVRPRWFPFLPGLGNLAEVNLRTYVQVRDEPGIWFLSVHADNPVTIRLARWFTPMPYQRAKLTYPPLAERPPHRGSLATPTGEGFTVAFEFAGNPRSSTPGSLDAWLLERYRLYLRQGNGQVAHGDVVHSPWSYHDARVEIEHNTLGRSLGLDLQRPPDLAQFSRGVRSYFYRFVRTFDSAAS